MNHDPNIVIDVEEESTGDNPEGDAVNADDMTDRLQILSNLRQKVVEEGVCRDDIEGLNNVLRGFNNEEVVSVETYLFTQELTFMNQSLALEGIGSGIYAVVKTAIRKLVQYAQQIYSFIKGLIRNSVNATELAADIQKIFPHVVERFRELVRVTGAGSEKEFIAAAIKKLGYKIKPIYLMTLDRDNDNAFFDLLIKWDDKLDEAVRASKLTDLPMRGEYFLPDTIDDLIEEKTKGDPDELLSSVMNNGSLALFSQFVSPHAYIGKVNAINEHIKALKPLQNKKLPSEEELGAVRNAIEMLNEMLNKARATVKATIDYIYERANSRKLCVQAYFEASRYAYEKIKVTEGADVNAAAVKMKDLTDLIRDTLK